MRCAIAVVAVACTCAASGVAASSWFALHGDVGFGVDSSLDREGVYSALQGTIRLGNNLNLDFGDFGRFQAGLTPHETYASVRAHGGWGAIAVGLPVPAFDRFAPSQLDALVPLRAADEGQVGATRSRLTWGAMYGHYLPWGVAYAGHGGDADWAVSVHQVPSRALTISSAGISWTGEDWSLAAAVERSSDGDSGGKIEAERRFGTVTASVGRFIAPHSGIESLLEGALRWQANERLELGALMQVPTGNGTKLSALAARYALGKGVLSMAITADHGNAAASLAVGWKF